MAFWGAGSAKAIQALIEEVKKRPVLWNPKHALYHHRTLVGDQWDEIAEILGTSTNLVKTKWKGLRDNFRKEVKKLIKLNKDVSPWIHMKHLNFLWTVLDTTQLECDKDKLQRLKDKHNAPKLSEEDAYIITHVRKIDDDTYFNSLQDSRDGDSSLDFHDFMFGDEIPVETSLITNENEEVLILPDDEIEEDLPPPPPQSPPPLRILHPRSFNLIPKIKEPKPIPVKLNLNGTKKFAVQSITDVDDSDMHFLKSILPYLAKLSPMARKRTHDQIRKIVIHEFQSKNKQKLCEVQVKLEPEDEEVNYKAPFGKDITIKKEPESIET